MENGFFVTRFSTYVGCNLVVCSGPYTVKNRPIILKKWAEDFDFKKESLIVLPIGIKHSKSHTVLGEEKPSDCKCGWATTTY